MSYPLPTPGRDWTDYDRGTKDGDVLQTSPVTDAAKKQLLALAGKNTALHTRHRLYVDVVSKGLPFLPHVPVWHALEDLNAAVTHFDVRTLDVVDLVVSKLKRFHANDRADISAMIERGLVDHALLVQRFRSAVDVWKTMAAKIAPEILRSLNRDFLNQPDQTLAPLLWLRPAAPPSVASRCAGALP